MKNADICVYNQSYESYFVLIVYEPTYYYQFNLLFYERYMKSSTPDFVDFPRISDNFYLMYLDAMLCGA